MEVHYIVQEAIIKTIPKKKKCLSLRVENGEDGDYLLLNILIYNMG